MTTKENTTTTSAESAPGDQSLMAPQTAVWCKVFCEKAPSGQEYYFTNSATGGSVWEEPDQDYYLWDYATGAYHVSGLQKPTSKAQLEQEKRIRNDERGLPYDGEKPDKLNAWQGFNRQVHGDRYDKNAPYAAYHNWLAYKEQMQQNPQAATTQQAQAAAYQNYDSYAQFNSHTGRYQTGEQSADRHDPTNRAARQMNAFFDVDTAANSHNGRSLKEERRNNKPSKKEVEEMNKKRKEKKQAKRMAFLKS